jgi:hypothetical protein
VFRLVIMPTGPKTPDTADLFKPFDTDKTFDSDAACRADAEANLSAYFAQRGLPPGATGNFACTIQ